VRQKAKATVESLQDTICNALEALDGKGNFQEDLWTRPGGGGGRTRIMKDGAVFEKAGVNVSAVEGQLPEALQAQLEGDGTEFFATGISLVLHPQNPHVPTTHANFRYIERGGSGWFGGGADLTPYVLYEEDAGHFHEVLGATCDAHNPSLYPKFKTWCDEYFYLPHRGEGRGVGGVFFDYLKPDESWDMDGLFSWWKAMGESFLPAYVPIAKRRKDEPFDEALRTWQLQRRGRYVEFNLVYDRGTIFGLKTDGRIESILMSLPSPVRWDYNVKPEAPYQKELLEALQKPRGWR
jgi:coproporphyrinogen III oxidase